MFSLPFCICCRWQVADTLGAKAIVVFTSRGTTVNKAAQLRPNVPVMGVTPNIETARGLALTWGVYPAVIETDSDDVNFRMMLFKVTPSRGPFAAKACIVFAAPPVVVVALLLVLLVLLLVLLSLVHTKRVRCLESISTRIPGVSPIPNNTARVFLGITAADHSLRLTLAVYTLLLKYIESDRTFYKFYKNRTFVSCISVSEPPSSGPLNP